MVEKIRAICDTNKQKLVPDPIPTVWHIRNRFHENNESINNNLQKNITYYIQFRKDMKQYVKDKNRISNKPS